MVFSRWAVLILFGLFLTPTAVWSQGGGGGGGGGGQGQGGGGPLIAGVEVDPAGVLHLVMRRDPTGRLMKEAAAASRRVLGADLARSVERRYVSMNRLEAALEELMSAGKPIPEEMLKLAGLTAIHNVFYFSETRDIVIAGPAEGFANDVSGRTVGIESGRSILELQDLIVALRAFSPEGRHTNVISVSIDATQEGLAKMQRYYAEVAPRARKVDAKKIANGMKNALGLQNVTIKGISPRTHFAQVLVEADYRMKMIGIGLEVPGAKIESYVSRANPQEVARNAMERWFFVPNYDCVLHSDDGTAMELVGEGVKLIGANERVAADGARVNSGEVNRASQEFVAEFTRQYPALAARTPVYGQLKNLIDMSIAAAYIQQQDFYGQAGWRMDLFGDELRLPVETYEAPTQVESAVNVVWKGSVLTTPVGGGVQIKPREALASGHIRAENERTSAAKRGAQAQINQHWWWD